ncbi:MAG: glutamine--fructose-6-phosphate transaminase (isomerizing), partial [Clostridia bacterium]|nr:glutamine--fructose-6-phosphate transaminase (isomerizing) [Clostridia bacterium]
KLEYRGYDSSGAAVLHSGKIISEKRVGKLIELEKATDGGKLMQGNAGIGHTRWATHGAPTEANAHPHFSADRSFAVVHNGIIENYLEIRQQLETEGVRFVSETDTEVIPHLLQKFYNGDVFQTVSRVMGMLRGAYALGIVTTHDVGHIYAVRKGAPLVVGLGENGNFVASDIPALLSRTRRFYLLDADEIALLSKDKVEIFDQNRNPISKELFEPDWDADAAKKDGYPYYMLKEIMEQPRAVRDTISPRLHNGKVCLDELSAAEEYYKNIRKIFIVACGSAYHAGVMGKYVIETLARVPVEVDLASEFRYRNPIIQKGDAVMIISQSGETLDSLEALRSAKKQGAHILSVVNVKGASIARESDCVLYTHAGPEIAVATTKAYSAQLQILFLFGLYLAQIRGTLSADAQTAYVAELRRLPDKIEGMLKDVSEMEKCAKTLKNAAHIFFIGRGIDYAVAMEGSLKLKEISYIHSEAYAAGELKHGTISLVEKGTTVIALATQQNLFEKTLNNIKEVKSRGAKVIVIAQEGFTALEREADKVIYVPKTKDVFSGALEVIPLQLLAYYISYHKG